MQKTPELPFEGHTIRHTQHEGQLYFAVVDVVAVLSGSPKPRDYWYRLKKREPQLSTNCRQLKVTATDGKAYATDCATREGLLRIIQAIPSPKAEPFKQWLARVGEERLQQTQSLDAIYARYRALGYPEDWIDQRVQNIVARKRLTNQWKEGGIRAGSEYAILTATLHEETFDVKPSEHKEIKQLKKENLRDHMTGLELAFSSLAEEAAKEFAKVAQAKGLSENKKAAIQGGTIAGDARRNMEEQTGKKVVSPENFKQMLQEKKKKK